ncbi:MAG TPA: hypothetical protein VJS64_13710 [Pyrinomonadaceae bacterium]|nr:hypothetical protein [Pyrinomonadaceae bacterium]
MRTFIQTSLCSALLLIASASLNAQTSKSGQPPLAPKNSASDLVAAVNQTKASNEAVIQSQETEIAKATASLESLRQLVTEGLVARVELEAAEQALIEMRNKLETARKNVTDSDRMIADLRKAEELAKAQSLIPNAPKSGRSFLRPTVLRYGGQGGWSLAGLSSVQSFFATTFGRALPVSALGQSSTHNRLGYDHRNAVDVAVHPDSAQGQALIGYLQNQGIPFLAFRGAIPGVATGPHIHIGSPSHRI